MFCLYHKLAFSFVQIRPLRLSTTCRPTTRTNPKPNQSTTNISNTLHTPHFNPLIKLPHRSWCYSERSKRRTLQKEDIQAAIAHTDILDFLVNIV